MSGPKCARTLSILWSCLTKFIAWIGDGILSLVIWMSAVGKVERSKDRCLRDIEVYFFEFFDNQRDIPNNIPDYTLNKERECQQDFFAYSFDVLDKIDSFCGKPVAVLANVVHSAHMSYFYAISRDELPMFIVYKDDMKWLEKYLHLQYEIPQIRNLHVSVGELHCIQF